MKKLLVFSCLMLKILCAIDTGEISSSNASYDGNALILKGQVMLDHGLGKMQAEEAILQKQEVGKDFPFSLIQLDKDVSLHLNSSGELTCESAQFDFTSLKGALTSSKQVSYADLVKKKKGKPSSLKITSNTIDLQLLKIATTEGTKAQYDIDSVVARTNVQLNYANNFTLFTDAILYQKALIGKTGNEFQSHLSSYGDGRSKLIHFADTIEADRFELDLVHQKLLLIHPEGVLPSLSQGEAHFTSDSLVWDHEKNTLLLKGSSKIEEPSLGTMTAEQQLVLFHDGQHLSGFKSQGTTSLTYRNSHSLISHGNLSFDRERRIGTAESPLQNGVVPEGLQLSYQETEISVLADIAHVEYTEENGLFSPVSVSLKGHVKISSAGPTPISYGLADRLTYHPTTRTFILGADPGKKVIFANDEDHLRISAQEIHITQDPTTKKQTVKGLGNVQLALSPEEQASLTKYFGHALSSP